MANEPLIAVIMGSESDFDVMRQSDRMSKTAKGSFRSRYSVCT